ncbi:MAG: tRNA dihydrouridine synthase DusB [Candidatus Goldbacteria bacterium]|nr:tRNA dihydrouridine synthase DusB [Candidatus Goldiibacteriota bacterium]
MNLIQKIKKFPFVLAPMAGYTDHAFRVIAKEYGASLVFTEMVSVYSIIHHRQKIEKLLYFSRKEKPIGIQLFGNNSDLFYEASKVAAGLGFDLIDINFGCPANKVVRTKAGAYLHKDLKAVELTIKNTIKGAGKLPVSIKMRSGWDENSKNFIEIAKIAEDNGVGIITLHPRTRLQMFKGKSDWDDIKKLKKRSGLFIIGSGDVVDRQSALKMLNGTGCDAVMIGRGAIGNPFIFREIKDKNYSPTFQERVKTAMRHFKLLYKFKGERGIFEMRKFYGKYIKGFSNASEVRNKIITETDSKKIIKILKSLI